MTPEQAESIIHRYGEALARGSEDGIARKLSWLPCSVCKVRLAFYISFREMIADKALNQDMGDQLKNAYHGLNHFVADDDAETINEIHTRITSSGWITLSDYEREIYRQFLRRISRLDELFEINSYINECSGQRDNQDFILQPERVNNSETRVD